MTIAIYIDSDVFVSAEIKSEKNYKDSKKFINFILKNELKNVSFFTSGFTLLEVVSATRRRTKSKQRARSLAWQLARSWKDKIERIEVLTTRSWVKFLDKLIETSIELGTQTGDTIHAQIVMERQIDYLITWNKKHFKPLLKKKLKLQIVTPKEFLSDIQKIKKRANGEDSKQFQFYLDTNLLNKYLTQYRNILAHGKQ
jgi:predicted nucleic acid-binding protein